MRNAILLLLSLAAPGWAQFSTTAYHIRYGATLPAHCNPNTGDVFFKTSATITVYFCSATDTWATMSGSGGSPGGTNGQIQFNNSSSFGGFTMGGDCTFSQPNITCTKTGGTVLTASATTSPGGDLSGTLANAIVGKIGGKTVTPSTSLQGATPTNITYSIVEQVGDSITLTGSLTGLGACSATTCEIAATLPTAVNGAYEFTWAKLVETTITTVSGGSVAKVRICLGRSGTGSDCELSQQLQLLQSVPNGMRWWPPSPIYGTGQTMSLVLTVSCFDSSDIATACGSGSAGTSYISGGVVKWYLAGVVAPF